MATSYNQVLVGNIDITETYKKLMLASTGQDSVYLRAKETISDSLASMVGLSENDRGKILAETISSIAKEITNSAMQMALKIDTENRDAAYALTKLKEDTRRTTAEIAKIEKDIEMTDKNLWLGTVTGWKAQAETYRDYGVQTWGMTEATKIIPNTAYIDYGTKVETLKKAKVDTYATYANSYRQNGTVNYTTNASDGSFASVTSDNKGLAYQQTKVAERQRQGFDDNMRQHVVNSSASMIGMLLSTESSGINYGTYLDKWSNAADYLNTNLLISGGTLTVSSWGTLDKSAGITISGTVVNIDAGRTVSVRLTSIPSVEGGDTEEIVGSVNIVQIAGTFSVVTPAGMLGALVVGTQYKVRVYLLDNAGNSVFSDNIMTAVA